MTRVLLGALLTVAFVGCSDDAIGPGGGRRDAAGADGATDAATLPDGASPDVPAPPPPPCDAGASCAARYRQYWPLYVRNWFADGTQTQWSDVVVNNTGDASADFTLVVRGMDGAELHRFARSVAAHASWNSHVDPEWYTAVPDADATTHGAVGWLELDSAVPLQAAHRLTMRTGQTATAPVTLFDDEPFTTQTASPQFNSEFFRNVPLEGGDLTQWSYVVIANPGTGAVNATITVRRNDNGQPLGTIRRTIAAGAVYNPVNDPEWYTVITDTEPTTHAAAGWIEVRADAPMVVMHRLVLRHGATSGSSVFVFDDEALAAGPASPMLGALYLRNWPADSRERTQWTALRVNNPGTTPAHVTVIAHRAEGGEIGRLARTVAPGATYDSHADPEWYASAGPLPDTDATNHASAGWIEVRSDVPVLGMSRLALRRGSTFDAPMDRLSDEPLRPAAMDRYHAWLCLRRWAADAADLTQWSTVVVNNPGTSAATVTLTARGVDGAALGQLMVTVPPGGMYNSVGDPMFYGAIRATDAATNASAGWLEVAASAPVIALHRLAIRTGTEAGSPLVLFDDDTLASPPTPQ